VKDNMLRALFEELAHSLADDGELAVRTSAVEEQADLNLPILDDNDLERALGSAADRIARRHELHLIKGKHHRREPLPQPVQEIPISLVDSNDP
jgi:hypothetical protein